MECSPLPVETWSSLGSSLPWLWHDLPLMWVNAVALALFPTIVSLVAMAGAIRRIGSTPTAILGALEPVTALFFDLSYNYQSRIDLGNCWVEPDHRLQAGVKKRFGDRFTASFSVQNLLDQGQVIGAHGDGFVRTMNARQTWSNRSFRIGLTYNFKSGKAFKRKAVEAGSADEKSRL